jgi:hypothetical protein
MDQRQSQCVYVSAGSASVYERPVRVGSHTNVGHGQGHGHGRLTIIGKLPGLAVNPFGRTLLFCHVIFSVSFV